MKIFLSALLQLVGGALFGLGLFGGSHADALKTIAGTGAWRMKQWFNWELDPPGEEKGILGTIGYHWMYGMAAVWGGLWMYEQFALSAPAKSLQNQLIAIALLTVMVGVVTLKLFFFRRYTARFGWDWNRGDIAIFALSDPIVAGLGLALFTLLIGHFAGWGTGEKVGRSLVMLLSLEVALVLLMTLSLAFSRAVRFTLILVGAALYIAGTVVMT